MNHKKEGTGLWCCTELVTIYTTALGAEVLRHKGSDHKEECDYTTGISDLSTAVIQIGGVQAINR